MKEIFFKGIAIALPCLAVGGLGYMIFHGFYTLYSDMQLKKELEEIKRDSAERRRQKPAEDRVTKAPSAEDFFQ